MYFSADNCILFCRATFYDDIEIQDLLMWYEIAYGQQVNRDKIQFALNLRLEKVFWQCVMWRELSHMISI